MHSRLSDGGDAARLIRTPALQFALEMHPLVAELSGIRRHFRDGRTGTDAGAIEIVSAPFCFVAHSMEIRVDARNWPGMFAKALELRMVFVALRLAPEDGTGEEPFTPEGDEALGIEIPGVQSP